MVITKERFTEIMREHDLGDRHIDLVWSTAGSNIAEETVWAIGRILATTIRHDFKSA
ncbi:MAG: hypothetical protein Q8Q17_00635 [bacterium]|nr:hypothetical protein [bacterium]